jgi:hypothetical protein
MFSFFSENTAILQIITFALVIIVVLTVTRRLLYQLIYAFVPESKSLRFVSKPRLVRIAIAIADIGAWGLAVMISCIVHRLPAVTQLLVSLFGIIWNLLPLTIIVLLGTYCFSRTGNELILSAIGGWYLPYRKKILERYGYFDLGNGQEAEIETINFLDTTFRLKQGGRIVVKTNAFLMHEIFGFAKAIGIEGIIDWWQAKQKSRRGEGEFSSEIIAQTKTKNI